MKQANQSGWYVNGDGNEVFIQKGTVRPDNHPDVTALPVVFDSLDLPEEPAKPSRAKNAR